MVFVTLVTSNILLTLVNRSFYYSIIDTLNYRNRLLPLVIIVTIGIVGLIFVYSPLRQFFGFERLQASEFFYCIGTGFLSVIWIELYKFFKRVSEARRPSLS